MIPYKTKSKKIPGTSYGEVMFEKKENLYRFAGLTAEKELFYVQIKEDKKRKRKYFMSCFPPG